MVKIKQNVVYYKFEIRFEGKDQLGRFTAILYKEDNFCDFLFAFLSTKPLLKKGSTLNGKNLLPVGANLSF